MGYSEIPSSKGSYEALAGFGGEEIQSLERNATRHKEKLSDSCVLGRKRWKRCQWCGVFVGVGPERLTQQSCELQDIM